MPVEYEATFINIDKDQMRARLTGLGAKLIKPEFLQKRTVFNLPAGHEIKDAWLRVRDEGDKITLSLKVVDGKSIEGQKEICLQINDFATAVSLLEAIGCRSKAYQESKRELWQLGEVDITIDEWPYLEPLLEIEGPSELAVKEVTAKMKLDYTQALFCSVDEIYNMKYGVSRDQVNNHTPRITFYEPNPFI